MRQVGRTGGPGRRRPAVIVADLARLSAPGRDPALPSAVRPFWGRRDGSAEASGRGDSEQQRDGRREQRDLVRPPHGFFFFGALAGLPAFFAAARAALIAMAIACLRDVPEAISVAMFLEIDLCE